MLHAFDLAPQVRAFHRIFLMLDAGHDIFVARLIADVDLLTA